MNQYYSAPDAKPCPFCGGQAEEAYDAGDWGYSHSSAAIHCKGCRATGPSAGGKSDNDDRVRGEALRLWNARAVT